MAVAAEKMQVQVQGGDGGVKWVHVDERDGFISWLRGEFAAANAMVDALCHHLRLVGEPGEYDGVIGCVQQRRANWSSVLHMQQYYSVAEVIYALHQVEWRRQQQRGGEKKDLKRTGGATNGSKAGWRNDGFKDIEVKLDDKKELGNSEANSSIKSSISTEAGDSQSDVNKTDDKRDSNSDGSSNVENEAHSIQASSEKQNAIVIPKTFVATEIIDGKPVNVVDGMKLYEGLLSSSEVSKLVALVNDLRFAGRRGQLPAQTFIVSKRPMKGHGREMIQLGFPIADPPEDDTPIATSKDRKMEAIPDLFQDVIERLSAMQVLTTRPDACLIDIFNEGDHSQPNVWPHWYGRPISTLFLTECEMTFGKMIGVDHPGDYRGSLKLSFAPGSILVMQGRSADIAKCAIPSIRCQRILVTLTKLQPRRIRSGDNQRFTSAGGPGPQWVPPPSRSPNHIRQPFGPKHYGAVSTPNVLPVPAVRPQLAPPNGIQPIFVPAAVTPPIPYPAPVALPPASAGWAVPPLRQPPPRLPLPGTGVFLPPSGSGAAATDNIPAAENPSLSGKDNAGSVNGTAASQKDNLDTKVQTQECNGTIDVSGAEKPVAESELH